MHRAQGIGTPITMSAVFTALHAARSFDGAAETMGLSVEAVRAALNGLRTAFNDRLFAADFEPTPRALELLATIDERRSARPPMLPEEAHGHFVIGAPTEIEPLLVPAVYRLLAAEAPRIDVTFVDTPASLTAPLVRGDVDVILTTGSTPRGLEGTSVLRDRYAVVLRDGHGHVAGGILPFHHYITGRHVRFTRHGETWSELDGMLALSGIVRDIAVAARPGLDLISTLQRSELIATVPEAVAIHLASAPGLQAVALPGPPLWFELAMVWSPRVPPSGTAMWLRHAIQRALSCAIHERAAA